MARSASKIKMNTFDDLFETSSNTSLENKNNSKDENLEKVVAISLENLVAFKDHPFKVLDDEKMEETKESISKYGVLVPIIARPCRLDNKSKQLEDGKYEIIAGHRRKHACILLGKETIPTLIRDLDDEESTIIMVDSNIQRENLLFSEKAFAFKMKLDAIKKQGKRTDLTCAQVGQKLNTSVEIVAEEAGESRNQIKRYIRLTELISELLDMVDNRKIPFNTGVELSYLSKEEQELLLNKAKELEVIPSMVQATKMKRYSSENKLTDEVIEVILLENKEKPIQVTLKASKIHKYFKKDTSKEEVEKIVDIALAEYFENRKDKSK